MWWGGFCNFSTFTRALFLDLCILFAHFGKFATAIVTPSTRHLRIPCQPIEYLQRCHLRKIGGLTGSGRIVFFRFCERTTQSPGLGYPSTLGESLQPGGGGGIKGNSGANGHGSHNSFMLCAS